jgi:hypothetical protein
MGNNSRILEAYSWAEFRAKFNKTALAQFTDEETGEVFTKVAFIGDTNKVFVGFSSKLGVLSKQELLASRSELRIVKRLKVSGTDPNNPDQVNHTLCKGAESAWEDLD